MHIAIRLDKHKNKLQRNENYMITRNNETIGGHSYLVRMFIKSKHEFKNFKLNEEISKTFILER